MFMYSTLRTLHDCAALKTARRAAQRRRAALRIHVRVCVCVCV
jgi:hypothetical protein